MALLSGVSRGGGGVRAYYNEIDPYCVAWLHNLMRDGLIAPGDVDERSITDVRADDLRGYDQCHFFAGIGGWSYALRLAGWPDDRSIWTGSCPCQPFSSAGQRKGFSDERHLWPVWFDLIRECRPAVCFGEQVASKDALRWLDGVYADLENEGYAFAPFDLCSAGVGAPHIRQRLHWVADSTSKRWDRSKTSSRQTGGGIAEDGCTICWLGDSEQQGLEGYAGDGNYGNKSGRNAAHPFGSTAKAGGSDLWLGYSESERCGEARECLDGSTQWNPWADYEIVYCADHKARRIEPGLIPLAYGIPGRVGRLRAYGNAINPWVAAEFIMAYMEVC
jgi:DNA (cytosine-5)-methyltransferase 1